MLRKQLRKSMQRGVMLLAATALVGVGFAGSARAFSYAPGDLIGITVENNTELIVDLGNGSSFTSSAPVTLPSQFSGTLSTAKFITLAVPDNTDSNGNVTFSAAKSIDVPSLNTPDGAFSQDLSNGEAALDKFGTGWMPRLNNIPLSGTGIFNNTANELVLDATTVTNGYTQGLNTAGDDKINASFSQFTGGVALYFNGGTTASGNLWTGFIDPNNVFGADLLTLDGTISAHDNGDGTVTFSLVPEPGTLLLLGSGIAGLLVVGRRRNAA